jgi:membrane protein YdbS with pleckstrin-like domain
MGWGRTTKIVQTNMELTRANRCWWGVVAYGAIYWWFAGMVPWWADALGGIVLGSLIAWLVGRISYLEGLRTGLGYSFPDEGVNKP